MKQTRCKYCLKKISNAGMPAHVHFRHRSYVSIEFSLNSLIQALLIHENRRYPHFAHLALPAPSSLTVYSTRALGRMAAPMPFMRRPKGYVPGQCEGRPSDMLPTKHFVWEN